MSVSPELIQSNNILNSISDEDFEHLRPHLSRAELKQGDILYSAEQPIDYLYFPTGAMISIIGYTEDGQSAEIGVIGREGIVGIEALLGSTTSPNEHTVQLSNGALRIEREIAIQEFRKCGSFHDTVLIFVRRFMAQVSQTAVCNRLHPLEQRLGRWLLMCEDRSPSSDLKLTQEFLAIMTGATRASVTLAAIALKSAGFISYTRGKISIIDHDALEDFSCECYRVVKNAYES
jgi:CRP-like cAMP-binding protein